jgi:hypothetical protein
MQGAIATGNLADIVIWEPDVEFELNDDYPVYFKHPVCLPYMSHFSCIMYISLIHLFRLVSCFLT